jgi:hypothetical protein
MVKLPPMVFNFSLGQGKKSSQQSIVLGSAASFCGLAGEVRV